MSNSRAEQVKYHVIGCGTGGYAIENLARLFAGDENKHTIHILMVM